MSLADDTPSMDATDQAALVRSAQVTSAELLDAAVERIEALDPAIDAPLCQPRGVGAGPVSDPRRHGRGPDPGQQHQREVLEPEWIGAAG